MTTKLLENCSCGRCVATQGSPDAPAGAAPWGAPGRTPTVGESWVNAAGDTVAVTATGLTVTRRGQEPTPPLVVTGITEATMAARGERVSVAEAVAAATATCKRLENVRPADPFEGKRVVGLCLAPAHDFGWGKVGGEVEKVIRTGARPQREYAIPRAHMHHCVSADHANGMIPLARDDAEEDA